MYMSKTGKHILKMLRAEGVAHLFRRTEYNTISVYFYAFLMYFYSYSNGVYCTPVHARACVCLCVCVHKQPKSLLRYSLQRHAPLPPPLGLASHAPLYSFV